MTTSAYYAAPDNAADTTSPLSFTPTSGRAEIGADRCLTVQLTGMRARAESAHDVIENSHASTALSYADGLAKAHVTETLRVMVAGFPRIRSASSSIDAGSIRN